MPLLCPNNGDRDIFSDIYLHKYWIHIIGGFHLYAIRYLVFPIILPFILESIYNMKKKMHIYVVYQMFC